ncbi:MAG: SDR family NAD(P)-dependent oxidoreductase [Holosporales bacterium]|jgi:NAD(P)-dependent dehydrogenase (short-subunit alcohol dehydrogenase family)
MSGNIFFGKGQTALITGGRTRLGAAFATHLEQRGYAVLRHSHTNTPGFLGADLGKPSGVHTLLAQLSAPVSVLIANAGVLWRNDDNTKAMWRVNNTSPRALALGLAARWPDAGGIIIFITDAQPPEDEAFSRYRASKRALQKALLPLAQQLAPKWRVHALAPGAVLQAPTESLEHFETMRAKAPLGGIGINDLTGALDFLLTAPKVTGLSIAVDGGSRLCR